MASLDAPTSDKQMSERKAVSDAVLVAAASALSYAVAYAYRSGFASYFGLPPLLLTPTVGGILQAGAAVGAILISLWVLVDSLWMFIPRRDSALGRSIKTLVVIFVMALLGLYQFFAYRWGWLIIVGLVAFVAFGQFIFPLFTQREIRGYENKLLAQQKVEAAATRSLTDELGGRTGNRVVLLFIACFVVVVFANSLGYQTAKSNEDYFVLLDTPDHVVAAMDDDMVILVAYDPAAMTLKRRYTIQRFTPERAWLLEQKHIGKLLAPPTLKASSPPPVQPSVSPTGSASPVQPTASQTGSSSPTKP